MPNTMDMIPRGPAEGYDGLIAHEAPLRAPAVEVRGYGPFHLFGRGARLDAVEAGMPGQVLKRKAPRTGT